MKRFTHPDCAAQQHRCRFNAASPSRISRLFLLSFFLMVLSAAVSAQPIQFALVSPYSPLLGADALDRSAPTVVDLYGDGGLYMVSGNKQGTLMTWYLDLSNPLPSFLPMDGLAGNPANPFAFVSVGTYSSPAFVDIDNDGDMDLFVGRSGAASFRYFRNDGGSFTEGTGPYDPFTTDGNPLNGFAVTGSFSSPAFVDLDQDGDMDCFSGRANGSFFHIRNDGTAEAPLFVVANGALNNPLNGASNGTTNSSPVFVDFDKDGDMDLVTGRIDGNLRYYRNTGFSGITGLATFSLIAVNGLTLGAPPGTTNFNPTAITGLTYSTPTILDIDGDEDMDVIFGVNDGRFRFVRNTSCNTIPTATCGFSAVTVNLDADGRFDFTAANFGGSVSASCGTPTGGLSRLGDDAAPTTPLALDCMDQPEVTVVYTATDNFNRRTNTCTVTVTVVDDIDPVAICISPFDVYLDEDGLAQLDVSSLDPVEFDNSSRDNCSAADLSFSLSASPVLDYDCSQEGMIFPGVFTLTVEDMAGNTSTCSVNVRVTDNMDPVPDVAFLAALQFEPCQISDPMFSLMAYAPEAVDNCAGRIDAVSVSPNIPQPSWTVGTSHTIVWTYNDGNGNTSTQNQTVQIVNNAPPTLICPGSITVNSTLILGNSCGETASWIFNCPGLTGCNSDINCSSFSSSRNSGDFFTEGTHIVTYSVEDNAGNTGFCTFTVTVAEPPVLIFTSILPDLGPAPRNLVIYTGANNTCGTNVTYPWSFSATDDCSTPQLSVLPLSGSFFPAGVTTNVTYTATDAKGNSAFTTLTVQVIDNKPPAITCPSPINVVNQLGQCYANVFIPAPTYSDNCPNSLVLTGPTFSQPVSGNQFPVGTTMVTYSVTDGVTPVTCTHTVTVTDTEKPKFGATCPPNKTFALSAACWQFYSWATPTATDNCSVSSTSTVYVPTVTVSVSGTQTSGTFNEGVTTVTYVATDPASNTGTCSFTVTVLNNTKPMLTCGISPLVVNITAATCVHTFTGTFTPVSGTLPTSSAELGVGCDPGKIQYRFASNNSPVPLSYNFPTGNTLLRAVATDVSGNVSTNSCAITLTVRDNVAPMAAVCPTNQSFSSASNTCGRTISSLPQPQFTDNCASSATLTANQTVSFVPAVVNNFFPVGVTTVYHTTKDGVGNTGNTGYCTFTVTVVDDVKPVATCPPNQVKNNDPGQCGASYSWTTPVFTDNCSSAPYMLSVTSVSSPPSVTITTPVPTMSTAFFGIGTTSVTYSATDLAGQTGTCSFTVKVNDTEGPAFTGCPVSPQVYNTVTCSLPAGVATWATPTVSDNCMGCTATLSNPTVPSGSAFPAGTTPVSYTATDCRGNVSTCLFNIVVREAAPPNFTVCPLNVTVPAGPNCSTLVTLAMLTKPLATDNCSTPVVTLEIPLPITATPGGSSFGIVWRATDGSSNTSTACSQTVTVVDQTPPSMTCPAEKLFNTVSQPCLGISPAELTAQGGLGTPTGSDNCSAVSFSQLTLPNYFPVGYTYITWQATAGALTTTCIQTVRVRDSGNPSITCPQGVTVFANQGACFATNPALGTPTASDNCSAVTLTNNAPAQYPNGPTVVTWTATDAGGRTAICPQLVTVVPNDEICTNGIDDDCDGLTDEDDLDCDPGGGGGNGGTICEVKLLASDGTLRDSFGLSGAIDGFTMIVGAPKDDAPALNQGSAYIRYEDQGGPGVWGQLLRLTAPDGVAGDFFGMSVDVDGDFAVVGAPEHNNRGAVYLYDRNQGGPDAWGFVKKITVASLANDQFGTSVEMDGDYIVVGAPMNDAPAANSGAAYVFFRNQGGANNWGLQKKIVASNALAQDRFGTSVSISADQVIVGAPQKDPSLISNAGSAYIYALNSGGANNWGQVKIIVAMDFALSDQFGYSVSISGTNALVGAYRKNSISGAAYIFNQSTGGANNWGQVKKLLPSDPFNNDQFAFSVALEGPVALIGSRFDDDNGASSGSAYTFGQNQGGVNNWGQASKIIPTDGLANDNFGQFVAIGSGYYLVGAVRDDIGANVDQGSAYVFSTDPNCSGSMRPGADNRDQYDTEFIAESIRCYPNPFNDVLNVEVVLTEEEEEVLVMVCDATGRVISNLFQGVASGENLYQWDGSRFNNGLYFIRIQSAGLQQVLPVVLAR